MTDPATPPLATLNLRQQQLAEEGPADPPSPDRMEQLARLRAEQRRRWKGGDRPPVERLLAEHPDLASDLDAVLDLLLGRIGRPRGTGRADQSE
jgi:hypothetical protein